MKPYKRKSITLIDKLSLIRKDIKYAFFISLISIFIIEVFLKEINSPYNWFYVLGDMYLKVCYSIIATSFFFLINQHLPKESRNIKVNRFVANKMVRISIELGWMLKQLGIEKIHETSEEEIIKACKITNPSMAVTEIVINRFDNWNDYLKYKTNKVKGLLNEVLTLNSTIESELLEYVVNMLDILDRFTFLDNKNINIGTNLSVYDSDISDLVIQINKVSKLLETKRYKLYTNTNMNDWKKERGLRI